MNAKERLRLYLEQRRDAGESELVLDSLAVDDVLQLLGATTTRRTPPPSAHSAGRDDRSTGATDAPTAEPRARAEGTPHRVRSDRPVPVAGVVDGDRTSGAAPESDPPSDWREALRALDAPPSDVKRAPTDDTPGVTREHGSRSDAQRAPSPPPRESGSLPAPAPATLPEGAHDADAHSERGGVTETSHAVLPLEQIPTGLVVGSPAHELFGGPPSPFATLDDIATATRGCQLCALHRTAKQAVPGEGDVDADFVCVGEAPGANEDEQGRPFVGPAGQLLTKILGAIQLTREQVFICNVLKHRPPGNRNPMPEEVASCSPYLVRQMELLKPKVIVALGTFAAQTLLQTKEPIGKLRGRIHRYYGVPLIVTYHPAALLRNPAWKRPTWEDVQLARRLLDRARGA